MSTPPTPVLGRETSPHDPHAARDRRADETIPVPAPDLPDALIDSRDLEGLPFGRYRLLEELGRGGMGVVWKAWDTRLKRIVALKQILATGGLQTAQVARFQREARLAAQLRDRHIVAVLDVSELEGQPYFTTEFIEGHSLDRWLDGRAGPRPPRATLLGWIQTVAQALQHAHENGVVHRDVKPGNIIIDGKGRPYVTDFGLAMEITDSASGGEGWARLTRSGSAVGTPQYMSPEQAAGELERIGPASDQFSLGAALYEALAGRPPFAAGNLRELLSAVLEKEPLRPRKLDPSIPRDLETICLKALEKDPARRYASMGEMAADLAHARAGEPIRARTAGVLERFARVAGKRKRTIIAALALAAAAGWLIAYGIEREREVSVARAVLEKSERVQRVISRFAALAPTLRKMEAAFFDSTRSRADQRAISEALWPRVAEFMDATPTDPASQSVMRALAGWARRLAGDGEEGEAWIAQARALDPSLPYGALFDALSVFSTILVERPLPDARMGPSGLDFVPLAEETAHLRAMRESVERGLAEAARAEVWGEGMAADLRLALEAVRAYQAGRWGEAEAGLGRVLGSGGLEILGSELRLTRAKARYVLRRFADGIADLDAVIEARPDQAILYSLRGALRAAWALDRFPRGEDTRADLRQAIADFDAALARVPDHAGILQDRAIALGNLADVESARGEDARPAYEAAIVGYREALRRDPRHYDALHNCALAWLGLAQARIRRGGDAMEALQGALADCDTALKVSPGGLLPFGTRGIVRQFLGDLADSRGEDPRPAYAQAVADFDTVLTGEPGNGTTLLNRAMVRKHLADWEAGQGQDPLPAYRLAQADLDAALVRHPAWALAFASRGSVEEMLGQAEARGGADPRPTFRKALDDFAAALRLNDNSADAWNGRGIVGGRLADSEAQRGGDGAALRERAIADYTEALRLDPDHPGAQVNRGTAYASRARDIGRAGGDPSAALKQALDDFGAALERNPKLWQARANRGRLLEQMNRPAEAVAEYEEALRLCPGQPAVVQALERARKAAKGK